MPNQESVNLWQGDREITIEDVAYIRTFAQQFSGLSRKELTYTLCEHLHWMTAAGQPKYTACTKLLLRLEATGEVELPPTRTYNRPSPKKKPPLSLSARTDPQAVLNKSLSELEPVRLEPVSGRENERLWNEYVERHHPLGYKNLSVIGCVILLNQDHICWDVSCLLERPRHCQLGSNGLAGLSDNG